MENFTYKKVDLNDTELMQKIYRLRYQVYAHECGFIRPEDYPNGMESDEYDPQSVHFAAINEDGDIIGTMRIILSGKYPLPIQKYCPQIKIDVNALPGTLQFAEISRLIISKRLRRRQNDGMYYEPQVEDTKVVAINNAEYMRRAKPMAFGLYREVYQESKRRNITHWYTLMEKSLWLLLSIHGFRFVAIGDEVDVYGAVRPYLGKVDQIEEEVSKKFPKFFDYFTENLEPQYRTKTNS